MCQKTGQITFPNILHHIPTYIFKIHMNISNMKEINVRQCCERIFLWFIYALDMTERCLVFKSNIQINVKDKSNDNACTIVCFSILFNSFQVIQGSWYSGILHIYHISLPFHTNLFFQRLSLSRSPCRIIMFLWDTFKRSLIIDDS